MLGRDTSRTSQAWAIVWVSFYLKRRMVGQEFLWGERWTRVSSGLSEGLSQGLTPTPGAAHCPPECVCQLKCAQQCFSLWLFFPKYRCREPGFQQDGNDTCSGFSKSFLCKIPAPSQSPKPLTLSTRVSGCSMCQTKRETVSLSEEANKPQPCQPLTPRWTGWVICLLHTRGLCMPHFQSGSWSLIKISCFFFNVSILKIYLFVYFWLCCCHRNCFWVTIVEKGHRGRVLSGSRIKHRTGEPGAGGR